MAFLGLWTDWVLTLNEMHSRKYFIFASAQQTSCHSINFFKSKLKVPIFLLLCYTVNIHCYNRSSTNFAKIVRQHILSLPRGGAKNHVPCHATKYFINRLLCQVVTFFSWKPISHCTEPYVTASIKFQPRMEMAIWSEREKLAASVDPPVHLESVCSSAGY